MPAATACPSDHDLQQLLRGEAPPDTVEAFIAHLEHCGPCADAVDRSLHGDTLVEAMRAQSTPHGSSLSPAVQALIDWLAGKGRSDLVSRPDLPTDVADPPQETPPPVSAVDDRNERFDFMAPPQGPDELGRLGAYRILKILGAGGMGVVFLAEDVQLKRPVALKVLKAGVADKPGANERFLREARLQAALEHENVVTIFQVGEERGVPFLAMPLLKGTSLEHRLRQPEPIPILEVIEFGRQVARGLAAAHEKGQIHRDIKPANLWLEPVLAEQGTSAFGSRVKILDFGLARAAVDEVTLTQPGALVGTPGYMAPEQARAEKVDFRCDLFSLGAVLYRMCTGRLPFQGSTTMAILTALAVDQPQPVGDLNPSVPPALAELIMQLLAKDPAARPASAAEVARRLGDLEAAQPALAAPPTLALPATRAAPPTPTADRDRAERQPQASPARPSRPSRLSWAIAAAVLLALVPVGYFFGGQIIRRATNRGQVVIVVEVDDPKMQVTVKENGVVIQDGPGKRVITLKAGEHRLEVIVKDASGEMRFSTPKFTLHRGGKKVVDVSLEIAKARKEWDEALAHADRRAAQWVLSIGGRIDIRAAGKQLLIAEAKELPKEAFQILAINTCRSDRVDPAGWANLKGLRHLTHASLAYTPIPDAGLAHLKDSTKLVRLDLGGTGVGDAGLAHLKGLKHLRILLVANTQVGSTGLAHIKGLANLENLDLTHTHVTGDGLVHLKGLTKLDDLRLANTQVSNAGLAHLKGLAELRWLYLNHTKVGDAELVHVKGLTKLEDLRLANTQVSNDGLVHLKGLTTLRNLDLTGTKVTAAGVAALRKALPRCIIQCEPAISDPDRWAAKWVLSVGGWVEILVARNRRSISEAKDLPKKAFQIYAIHGPNGFRTQVDPRNWANLKGLRHLEVLNVSDLWGAERVLAHLKDSPNLRILDLSWAHPNGGEFDENSMAHLKNLTKLEVLYIWGRTQLGDAGLRHLRNLKNLQQLNLHHSGVTNAALADLKGLTKLVELDLTHCHQVGDAGLEHLKGLTKLERLYLQWAGKVSNAGIANLKDLTNLTHLDLSGTQVSDAGLEHLVPFSKLSNLSLVGTHVTDAGLRHLLRLPKLGHLDIQDARVSAKGFADLRGTLPRVSILWAERNRTAATAVLALGGRIHLRPEGREHDRVVKADADLPAGYFRLTRVSLAGIRKPLGDLLAKLGHLADPKFDRLERLDLSGTAIAGADLGHLRQLTSLTDLSLAGTQVGEGLDNLRGLTGLRRLVLDEVPLRGPELAHLKDLPALTELRLSCPKLGDLGVHLVGDLKRLTKLSLARSQVSNAGLKSLHRLKSLNELDLTGTKVTAAGVAALQKALPKCHIFSGLSGAPTAAPPGGSGSPDAERRAAKWARSLGGRVSVRLAGKEMDISEVKDPATAEFQVLSIALGNRAQRERLPVTDAGLANLEGLTALSSLGVENSPVTDDGLAHLRNLTTLRYLDLFDTWVGDAGLAHLAKLKKLTHLTLASTRVTDEGMARLKHLTNVIHLSLDHTRVGDAGLARLKGLTNLADLRMGTRVTDRGLVHLKAFPKLSELTLRDSRVTDEGLAHLQKLSTLSLEGTQVTDAGLPHLKKLGIGYLNLNGTHVGDAGLPALINLGEMIGLDLYSTRVSSKGIATLRQALPRTRISWQEANSLAAEIVLAMGGTVQIRDPGQAARVVRRADNLPAGYFHLVGINLAGVKDARLSLGLAGWRRDNPKARLGDRSDTSWRYSEKVAIYLFSAKLDQLEALDLSGAPIEKDHLDALKRLPALADLSLARTQVGDDGLETLAGCKKLRRLVLDGCPVRGPGLAHLKDLPTLTELRLGSPPLTDVFLPRLAPLKRLEKLSLAGSKVGDDGLKSLHGLKDLTELDLGGTKVTAAGVAALQKALPKCHIFSGLKGK
jgi:serine/threonine protein kinase/Leucine-rich repeat (LRR) protein